MILRAILKMEAFENGTGNVHPTWRTPLQFRVYLYQHRHPCTISLLEAGLLPDYPADIQSRAVPDYPTDI